MNGALPAERVKPDTVLFDVDGTLIDSTYHHAIAWSRAFSRFGLWPPLWRVHRSIGMGGDKLVPALVGHEAEKEHGEALRHAWQREYRRLLGEVRAFAGAADAVHAARDAGFAVAIASSGQAEFTDAAMELVGLRRADVDAVTSSDDAEHSKPAPDILRVALQHAGGTHGVLVGDSTWDVESASRVHIPTVGVRSGGFCEGEMREAGAVLVVDAVTDLRDGAWLSRW